MLKDKLHLFLAACVILGSQTYGAFPESLKSKCPNLVDKIWTGKPKGLFVAGIYHEMKNSTSLETCVFECCSQPTCNIVFMHSNTCFWVECASDDGCSPIVDSASDSKDLIVLVRPVQRDDDLQEANKSYRNEEVDDPLEFLEHDDPMVMSGSESTCICPKSDEKCVLNDQGSPECVCKEPSFTKNPLSGNCEPFQDISNNSTSAALQAVSAILPKMYNEDITSGKVPAPATIEAEQKISQLTVRVRSKDIRLPENEAVLNAYVVPAKLENNSKYLYKWDTLYQPKGSPANSEVIANTLKLTRLTQGLYQFKVTVTGPNGAQGTALANLTVLPQNRENKPPVAIIRPESQIVKLPNSMAVLDASASSDDSGIAKFHWELQEGPLGYQLNSTDTETLVLKNLEKPGNYSFRVTVTDNEGGSSSSMAHVKVLEAPDYPPVANAGPSIVLYLPQNNITLNGSLSSDDKGITSWEWTKSGKGPAVDMQNTHSPFLQLSLLTEGLYTFNLRVSDKLGQSSSSETIVLVKKPSNSPPKASAGNNLTVTLPQSWAILNGSSSMSDVSIKSWMWTQLSGPNVAVVLTANDSIANVTSLTKGLYTFRLKIVDSAGNSGEDVISVNVVQSVNVGPVANAGGDQTVSMPVDVLVVNGSNSRDDVGIASWQWTREPTSLAIGTIINRSDKTPVLMVTNIVTGRYEFRLRVTDDQGEFSEDTVSINVKPDAQLLSLVELTLNVEAWQLMESQKESVLAALGVVLKDASQLVVRDIRAEAYTGRASIVFYCTGTGGIPLPGPAVVSSLKSALVSDTWTMLHLSVASLRTAVCQNNCSGHGVCVESTRACLCEAFWMEDLISKYFGEGEANCDWSILYVLLALVCIVVAIILFGWAVTCVIQAAICYSPHQTSRDHSTPANKYKLLNSSEHIKMNSTAKMEAGTYSCDEETDSDVLFESRSQQRVKRSISANGRMKPLMT